MRNTFKRVAAVTLAVVVCCAVFANPAMAKKENTKEETQKVRICFPNQDGLSEVSKDKVYGGYTFDYANKIAQYTGWDIEYVTFEEMDLNEELMESMAMVKSGEADMIGGMLENDQLEKMYEYPDRHYGLAYTTFGVAENNVNIDSTNYMRKKVLKVALIKSATTRNEEVFTFLKNQNINYEKVWVKNIKEQVNAVKDGRADVLAKTNLSFYSGIRDIAKFAARPFYFAATKGRTDLTKEIDKAIAKISSAYPEYQKDLSEEYFGKLTAGFEVYKEEQEFLDGGFKINALCMPSAAPYSFLCDDSGEAIGIGVSLMKDVAKAAGIEAEFEVFKPGDDLEKIIDSGEYNCILGTPTNEKFNPKFGIATTIPYLEAEVVKYAKRHADLKDQKNKIIALPRGSKLTKTTECKEVKFYNSIEECLMAVNKGEADFGIGNNRSINFYRQKHLIDMMTVTMDEKHDEMEIGVPIATDQIFIRLLNRYISNLDISDIYRHSEEAFSHIKESTIKKLVRDNPVGTVVSVIIFVLVAATAIFALLSKRKNREYTRQLEKLNSAKSDFLSRMSHDMRTPLNGIMGSATLAKLDKNKDNAEEYLEDIISSSRFMISLVNDILDMSKIEKQAIEINEEPVDIREFIDQLNNLFTTLAEERGVTFELDYKMTVDSIVIDKLRVNQIAFNLLSNGVKFTKPGGKVRFTVENQPPEDGRTLARIIVEDNGIGMSKEFQARMYDTFARSEQGTKVETTGTGLGLPITKSLVEVMGGKIECESELGIGTRFVVTGIVDVYEGDIIDQNNEDNMEPVDLKGVRVLLCEDHNINAKIAIKILEGLGVSVNRVVNGAEGVSKFTNSSVNTYDAIIMDIRMPIMDGFEATKLIRESSHPRAKTIPIIALTANAFDDDIASSHSVGMDAHLSKPIDIRQLELTLNHLIRKNPKIQE
ncbi:MAG: transporter substrate-binding domain-containing protein [Anaerovoracaceae bacterium]